WKPSRSQAWLGSPRRPIRRARQRLEHGGQLCGSCLSRRKPRVVGDATTVFLYTIFRTKRQTEDGETIIGQRPGHAEPGGRVEVLLFYLSTGPRSLGWATGGLREPATHPTVCGSLLRGRLCKHDDTVLVAAQPVSRREGDPSESDRDIDLAGTCFSAPLRNGTQRLDGEVELVEHSHVPDRAV